MKIYLFIVSLLVLLVSPVVFAQEEDIDEPSPMQELERQVFAQEAELELKQKQLQLQQLESEMEFKRQMRKIELEQRKFELEKPLKALEKRAGQKKLQDDEGGSVFIMVIFIVNILLAIWVYTDIRKRNAGSGIWIVVVLLTGLLGVIPYAIVRLGDIRKSE
jgi:competence protein ComGC